MPPTLHVLPNPFAALDADGDPAAAFPRVEPALRGALVGARIDHARSADSEKYLFDTDKAVQLPDLPAYRKALREGDLLCADEATARLVGLPFQPPALALEQAAAKAAARWLAETGAPPAWCRETPAAPAPASAAPTPSPSDPTPAPAPEGL